MSSLFVGKFLSKLRPWRLVLRCLAEVTLGCRVQLVKTHQERVRAQSSLQNEKRRNGKEDVGIFDMLRTVVFCQLGRASGCFFEWESGPQVQSGGLTVADKSAARRGSSTDRRTKCRFFCWCWQRQAARQETLGTWKDLQKGFQWSAVW